MNPFLMPHLPPVKELWKKEISQYRLWVILFFIGVFIVASLSLTALLIAGVNMTSGINILNAAYQKQTNPPTYDQVRMTYIASFIIIPVVMFAFIITSIGLVTYTTIVSYKTQNFARLSGIAIFIVQASAFIAVINIVQILFTGVSSLILPSSLFTFIVNFLFIPVWFFANRLSAIRKQFLISEKMEKLKTDPQYQQMQAQMQNMMQNPGAFNSPFGVGPMGGMPNATPAQNNSTPNQKPETPASEPMLPKVSETDSKLSSLTMPQLKNIAKKLYISGYDIMKREELIESIKRATNQ